MSQMNELIAQIADGTELHFESGLCGDWALNARNPAKVGLHLVTQGHCWFTFPGSGQTPQQLQMGDAIFINKGTSHIMSASRIANDVARTDIPSFIESQHKDFGLVCYDMDNPNEATDTLFQLLPAWVVLKRADQTHQLAALITMIRKEVLGRATGYLAVIQRLSDVVAIQLLREVIARGDALKGPLAALNDNKLRPVVMAIMAEPGEDWRIERMAEKAFLSNSAFAERCLKQTGLTPKKLADHIRLHSAKALLKRSTLSLDQIAAQVGYQSSTAFGRFFKKYTGISANDFRESE